MCDRPSITSFLLTKHPDIANTIRNTLIDKAIAQFPELANRTPISRRRREYICDDIHVIYYAIHKNSSNHLLSAFRPDQRNNTAPSGNTDPRTGSDTNAPGMDDVTADASAVDDDIAASTEALEDRPTASTEATTDAPLGIPNPTQAVTDATEQDQSLVADSNLPIQKQLEEILHIVGRIWQRQNTLYADNTNIKIRQNIQEKVIDDLAKQLQSRFNPPQAVGQVPDCADRDTSHTAPSPTEVLPATLTGDPAPIIAPDMVQRTDAETHAPNTAPVSAPRTDEGSPLTTPRIANEEATDAIAADTPSATASDIASPDVSATGTPVPAPAPAPRNMHRPAAVIPSSATARETPAPGIAASEQPLPPLNKLKPKTTKKQEKKQEMFVGLLEDYIVERDIHGAIINAGAGINEDDIKVEEIPISTQEKGKAFKVIVPQSKYTVTREIIKSINNKIKVEAYIPKKSRTATQGNQQHHNQQQNQQRNNNNGNNYRNNGWGNNQQSFRPPNRQQQQYQHQQHQQRYFNNGGNNFGPQSERGYFGHDFDDHSYNDRNNRNYNNHNHRGNWNGNGHW